MNAYELRHGNVKDILKAYNAIEKNEIYIICDSIQDTFNVGQIFRLADQIGAKEVMLTGISLTPNNKQIEKSSMCLSKVMNWSYTYSITQAIKNVRSCVDQIIAIELTEDAVAYNWHNYPKSIALILGNESRGVSKEALDLCDIKVKIPMHGLNHSMNVAMSLAVVGNHIVNEMAV
jgi:tRNA G18 (ribose-2'-O)-methylase SpoU